MRPAADVHCARSRLRQAQPWPPTGCRSSSDLNQQKKFIRTPGKACIFFDQKSEKSEQSMTRCEAKLDFIQDFFIQDSAETLTFFQVGNQEIKFARRAAINARQRRGSAGCRSARFRLRARRRISSTLG